MHFDDDGGLQPCRASPVRADVSRAVSRREPPRRNLRVPRVVVRQ